MRSAAHSGAGLAVLRSPRRSPPPTGSRWPWIAFGVVVAVALIWALRSLLAILVASIVLGWLLDRPTTWLAARGGSRGVAFGLLLAVGVTALIVAFAIVVPIVVNQIQALSVNLATYLRNVAAFVEPYRADIEARLGVPLPVDMAGLADVAPEYLRRLADIPDAQRVLKDALAGVAGGGLRMILGALTLSLVPLFTFYVCVDFPRLLLEVDSLVPERNRPLVRRVATEIDVRAIAFVKGQVTVAFALGIVYSVGLLLSGIDLALLIGLGSGALFLLPYVGPLIGASMGILLALLKFGIDWHVLVVIATYVSGQVLENTVLTPKIVGDRVGLHPMVVMVAIVVFGNLLGIWGLVLAVPVTAALSVIAGELLAAYRRSTFYAHP